MKADESAFPNTYPYREGATDAISDVLDVISEHIPSMSQENENDIAELSMDVDADLADLALRTCACGERIDGFYEYVDHLKSAIRRALIV